MLSSGGCYRIVGRNCNFIKRYSRDEMLVFTSRYLSSTWVVVLLLWLRQSVTRVACCWLKNKTPLLGSGISRGVLLDWLILIKTCIATVNTRGLIGVLGTAYESGVNRTALYKNLRSMFALSSTWSWYSLVSNHIICCVHFSCSCHRSPIVVRVDG